MPTRNSFRSRLTGIGFMIVFLIAIVLYAATVNLYPTANTPSGTVTNPTQAYSQNDTGALVSSNSSSLVLSSFPNTDLGTISNVTVWVRYRTSAAPSNDTYQFDAAINGTTFSSSIVAANTTNRTSYVTASLSLGVLSWAQVGTLAVRCLTTRNTGPDGYDVDWDVGYIVVTYTPAANDTVTVTQTNVPSANVPQGTTNKLLQVLDLSLSPTGNGTATLDSLTVTRLGTAVNADTTASGIKLWHDVNNSNTWDAGDTQLDGSQTFAGSTVTFSSINFAINNGTPEKLLITANIAAAGTSIEGHTIGSGINQTSHVLLQGSDVVSMSAPLNGNTHTITDSGDILTIGQTATAGGNITKGTTNNVVMVLDLSANTDSVTLSQLVVARTGTAVDADTTATGIKLWNDVNGSNTWDGGDLQLSTSKTFSGGTVTFDAINFTTTAGAPKKLLITYDIASGATAGHTIGAQIVNAGQVTVNAPDSAALTATPLTGNSFTIAEPVASVLTVGQTSTGGGNLTKGSTNGVVMVLDLSVDTASATLTQLVVTRTGTAVNADTTSGGIKLWNDVNGSNTWDAGDAQLDGSQTFSGTTVTFSSMSFTINSGTPRKLLITYDIASGATAGHTIGAQIANAGQVTVNAPNTVTLTATPLTGDSFTIVEAAQNGTNVQTNSATANTCNQITVTSTFTGDANQDGSMLVRYATTSGGAPTGTVVCSAVTGPSPRQCVVVNTTDTPVAASTTYYFYISYTDSDGVTGNNNQTISAATGACGTDNAAPTLLVLSPSSGATLSGPEKFKVQIYDAGGLKATNPVEWAVDGGGFSSANVSTNTNYSFRCSSGNGCWVYEISLDTTAYSNADHYITIQVTDNATPANVARTTRAFKVNNSAGGSGYLLRRSHGSQLCIDCHNLKTHSSQNTSTKYGNWAIECLSCHTPHATQNIYLVREQLQTPRSGKKTVYFQTDDTAGETNPGGGPGNRSFLGAYDGPPNYVPNDDGLCEACHTRTGHWRNTGPQGTPHNASTRCLKCHTHDAGFKGAGGNCLDCHQTGGAATLAPYNKRPVEVDFGKQSHHVGARYDSTGASLYATQTTMGGRLSNYDCVVCHAEGLVDGNGETQANGDYHQNQVIDLKNADNTATVYSYNKAAITGAVGTWGTGNSTWVSQTKDNLDPFCLSCHDANGAVASYSRGPAGTDAPAGSANNPFGDKAITNEVDQLLRTDGATYGTGNMKVIDINSMVTGTSDLDGDGRNDPPQGIFARHAIRTNTSSTTGSPSRYGSNQIPSANWTSTTWNDQSVMGCADCHTVDGANTTAGNAHGSNSEYLLKDASGGATEGTFSGASYVCYRCHTQSKYSDTNPAHSGSGSNFLDSTASTGGARITAASKSYGTIFGMACLNCHGGARGYTTSAKTTLETIDRGFGRIHGTSSYFGTGQNGAGAARAAYRFQNGGGLRYYDPGGWTGSSATCYTLAGQDTWSGCAQHNKASGQSFTRDVVRPLSY